MKDKDKQYIEGDRRTRLMFFAFLAVGIIGSLFALLALEYLRDVFTWPMLLPPLLALFIVGIYHIWIGARTMHAGIYPPPGVMMPFKQQLQTGLVAYFIAAGQIIIGLCNLAFAIFVGIVTKQVM